MVEGELGEEYLPFEGFLFCYDLQKRAVGDLHLPYSFRDEGFQVLVVLAELFGAVLEGCDVVAGGVKAGDSCPLAEERPECPLLPCKGPLGKDGSHLDGPDGFICGQGREDILDPLPPLGRDHREKPEPPQFVLTSARPAAEGRVGKRHGHVGFQVDDRFGLVHRERLIPFPPVAGVFLCRPVLRLVREDDGTALFSVVEDDGCEAKVEGAFLPSDPCPQTQGSRRALDGQPYPFEDAVIPEDRVRQLFKGDAVQGVEPAAKELERPLVCLCNLHAPTDDHRRFIDKGEEGGNRNAPRRVVVLGGATLFDVDIPPEHEDIEIPGGSVAVDMQGICDLGDAQAFWVSGDNFPNGSNFRKFSRHIFSGPLRSVYG